ncbi:hypothetical protein K9K77_02005 [Candidatus Babeliales bacterium]|nr:hypothetical protein [Candidatus Babeliales bacterium]
MKRIVLLMILTASCGVRASEDRMTNKERGGVVAMTIVKAAKYPTIFMACDVLLRENSTFSDICIKFGAVSMITYGVSKYGYEYARSLVKKENHLFADEVSNNLGFGLGLIGVGLYYKR